MSIPSHLLERAYQLINANQIQNAELVLDAVVRVDPLNIDAWKTYMQIHQSQNDLDWLKDRILRTRELSETEKNNLVNYYNYLTQQINARRGMTVRNHPFALSLKQEQNATSEPSYVEKTSLVNHYNSPTQQLNSIKDMTVRDHPFALSLKQEQKKNFAPEDTVSRFELIGLFNYPPKVPHKEPGMKLRRKVSYSALAIGIANGVLSAILRDPLGRKVAANIQQIIKLGKGFVNHPRDTYVKISNFPHFQRSVLISLLTLFGLGVRLVSSGYFLGYLLLAVFIVASGWILSNYEGRRTNQIRVYMHENKDSLPIVTDLEAGKGKDSDIEDFENTRE